MPKTSDYKNAIGGNYLDGLKPVRYGNSAEQAAHLLNHYFKLVMIKAGLTVDSDTEVEITSIVENTINASIAYAAEAVMGEVKAMLEDLKELQGDAVEKVIGTAEEAGKTGFHKPVCFKCGLTMKVHKNGVAALETIDRDKKAPYRIWYADQWVCSGCGDMILKGFADTAMYPGDEKFAERLKQVEVTFY